MFDMSNARSTFVSSFVSSLWAILLVALSIMAGYMVLQVAEISDMPGLEYLPSFLHTPLTTQTETQIIITLAAVIAGFSVLFIVGYVGKALLDSIRLIIITQYLKQARKIGKLENPDSGLVDWYWSVYPLFSRLWGEFSDTLHCQTHPDAQEGERRVLYRATIPAEMVFNTQTLVDVPMRVEFFRHLPGILTGAGIVSTFAGILVGLTEFNPAVEADLVTQELKNLFVGVSTAFVASFFAIFCAILITVIEKLILQWRYSQVVALQWFLDDCFKAGAEPEYLAKLVENGDAGLLRMESSLSDLASALKTLPNQPATQQEKNENLEAMIIQLSETLAVDRKETVQALDTAIQEGFSVPLRVISKAVELTLGEQSRRLEEIRNLENRLAGFGERMDVALTELSRGMKGFNEAVTLLEVKQGENLSRLTNTISETSQHQQTGGQSSSDLAYFQTIAEELKALRNDQNRGSVETSKQSEHMVLEFNNRLQETIASFSKQLPSQEGMTQLFELLKKGSNDGISEAQESTRSIVAAIENTGVRQEKTLIETLHNLEDATAARLKESTEEVKQSFKENIDSAVDGEADDIKNAVKAAAEEILSLNEPPSFQEVISAIGAATNQQEAVLRKTLQALEEKNADELRASTEELTSSISDSINIAVADSSNEIKDAVNEAILEVFNTNDSPSPQEIINAIQNANSHQESSLSKILQGLEAKTADGLKLSAQEITNSIEHSINSAVSESSDGIKGAVNDAIKEIFSKTESTASQEIINAIGNANTNQETVLAKTLQDLEEKTADGLKLSAQEITNSIESSINSAVANSSDEIKGAVSKAIEEIFTTNNDDSSSQEVIKAIGTANSNQEVMLAKIMHALESKPQNNQTLSAQEITDTIAENISSAVAGSSDEIEKVVKKTVEEIFAENEPPSDQKVINAIGTANSSQEVMLGKIMHALESKPQNNQTLSAQEITDTIAENISSAVAGSSDEIEKVVKKTVEEIFAKNEPPSAQEVINAIGSANSNQEAMLGKIIQALELRTPEGLNLSAHDISDTIAENINNALAGSSDKIEKVVEKTVKEIFAENASPSSDEVLNAIGTANSRQELILSKLLQALRLQNAESFEISADEITQAIAESVGSAIVDSSEELKKAVEKTVTEIFSENSPPSSEEIVTAIGTAMAQQESALDKVLQEMGSQAATDLRESAEDITHSIAESINSAVSESSDEIKNAVEKATKEILDTGDLPTNQDVISAIGTTATQQTTTLAESIKDLEEKASAGMKELEEKTSAGMKELEEKASAGMKESTEEITNSLENSINSVVSEGYEGIKEAVQAGSNGITEAVSEGYGGIKSAVAEGYKDLEETIFENTDGIKKVVYEGMGELSGVVAENADGIKETVLESSNAVTHAILDSSEGVKQAVYESSGGIKGAISDASKEIISATGPDSYQEIFTNIQNSANQLEKAITKSFQELDSNNSNRLKTSSREIVSTLGKKIDKAAKEMLVANTPQTIADSLPTQQFLTEFKEHLNKLIVSLANRINQVGNKIAQERQALEKNLSMLETSLKSTAESQGQQTKEHMDSLLNTSQDKLGSDISQLGGSIHDELNLLQALVKKTSGDLSTRLASTPNKPDKHDIEQVKQLEAEFKSAMEQLNQRQDDIEQNREENLINQVVEKNSQLAKQLEDSVRDEMVDTKQSISQNIRQARDEQSEESAELTERIMLLSNISDKMSGSVSEITSGLSQLREKVTSEKESLSQTMQGWVSDLSSANKEGNKDMASKIEGVMNQVENRHEGMINAINQLNSGMGSDLEEMKEKILHSGRESEKKLSNSFSKVGKGVENTVQQTSEEQTAYIELLGERLDTMRKRLRVK
jgi:putative membrane protein